MRSFHNRMPMFLKAILVVYFLGGKLEAVFSRYFAGLLCIALKPYTQLNNVAVLIKLYY